MQQIFFTVEGTPKGKMRARRGFGKSMYTPQKNVDNESEVLTAFVNALGGKQWNMPQAARLLVMAYCPIAASASKAKKAKMLTGEIRPTCKPDIDNVIKLVMDSGNGVMWHDDACIVHATGEKHYSTDPRVEVTISEIELPF